MMLINKQFLKYLSEYMCDFDRSFIRHIKNQEIPLAERWELYTFAIDNRIFDIIDSSEYKSKILHLKVDFFSWQKTFIGINYCQVVRFPDIINVIEVSLMDTLDPDCTDVLEDCLLLTFEEIDELREEFLASGLAGFTCIY